MSRRIDMIGRQYGKLKVVGQAPSRKGHCYWLCQCECGNMTTVDGGNLRSGHTTSCGHCEKYEPIDDSTMICKLPSGETFLFDIDDFPIVKEHKWSIENSGYVHTTINGKHIRLHRILMGYPDKQVDHINGDRSDNRRSNLRLCTNQENHRNTKLAKNNASGYKGVHFDNRRKKYYASIVVSGKSKFLGYYDSPLEAAKSYDKVAELYFGEFSRPNFRREVSENGQILEMGN